MDQAQLKSTFDAQAPNYDQQWKKLAPFREALHLLVTAIFRTLPSDARILCVGAGTGAEVHSLAEQFPGWTFTVVDLSAAMLEACRKRAEEHGFAERCVFYEGSVDTLPDGAPHHAATCFLVSQFILQPRDRTLFFRAIADRLVPGGLLASSDLASDVSSKIYQSLLEVWFRTMASSDLSPEALQRMRDAYARDVAILPPEIVEQLLVDGGFELPVQFYQVGLIHAWYSKRT